MRVSGCEATHCISAKALLECSEQPPNPSATPPYHTRFEAGALSLAGGESKP